MRHMVETCLVKPVVRQMQVAETCQHQIQQSEVQTYNLKGTWEYMAETCLVYQVVQKYKLLEYA